MVQIRKMGSFSDLINMIPGMNKVKQLKNLEVDDNEFVRIEAIINSMTPQERRIHTIINGSRRKRIAKGSGTRVQDVNKLIKKLCTNTQDDEENQQRWHARLGARNASFLKESLYVS